ncbi:MAG: hypothetical protein CM15mP73_3560 [Hyphomicrobiales bacterium]|nr:MAG: hypothetical protein CM15mP73_3560 [Hyphomicrobiales bacterium]
MTQEGLEESNFVVANTDAQALAMSSADRRIQMGTNPNQRVFGSEFAAKNWAAAAQRRKAEILDYSQDHTWCLLPLVWVAERDRCGAVIAQLSRSRKPLTVAVVTKPFQFEGVRRMEIADKGIEKLSKYVDTLIVIPNQNLFRIANEKLHF